MTTFGNMLRVFRQHCSDPENPGRGLSQERLGDLLGEEMNMRPGYSGAAISDWELGKSKIHADHRLVLVSLIKIFNRFGSIQTLSEANQFLEAGNYRALDASELAQFSFGEQSNSLITTPNQLPKTVQPYHWFVLERLFSLSEDEFHRIHKDAYEGPAPYWPRVFVALFRKLTKRWSATELVKPIFWLWTALLTYWTIIPALRWPFADRTESIFALHVYAAATIVIPLFIGALTDTVQDSYWKERSLANAHITRLYTYQGASVGFHVGYFGVFAFNMVRFYARIPSATWVEFLEVIFILIWAYLGARLVPYNLWRAYERLQLADGWRFFIFVIVGPLFAWFFFTQFYTLIISSFVGGISFLLAMTILIVQAAWQQYRSKTKQHADTPI